MKAFYVLALIVAFVISLQTYIVMLFVPRVLQNQPTIIGVPDGKESIKEHSAQDSRPRRLDERVYLEDNVPKEQSEDGLP